MTCRFLPPIYTKFPNEVSGRLPDVSIFVRQAARLAENAALFPFKVMLCFPNQLAQRLIDGRIAEFEAVIDERSRDDLLPLKEQNGQFPEQQFEQKSGDGKQMRTA